MEVRVNRALMGLAVALVVFGVIMRLLPHPANLAPVGAIALFGGAILPRKLGWWLPLAIMVVSDIFIGFYNGIGFNWLGFLFVGLYGMALRSKSNLFRIPVGTLGASLLFFAVSNFGVWAQGQIYPHSWAGLINCYVMAIPFLRNTLVGDLAYTALLFGAYALASRFITNSYAAQTDKT